MGTGRVKVMHLWRVQCRRLGYCQPDRTPFAMHIATKETSEKEVVRKIKRRFTSEWWEDVLILDVSEAGDLHMIEDQPLYEGD